MEGTPNYGFILSQVADRSGRSARILDFGCGAGELVAMGRAAGFDIVGADSFVGSLATLHRHRRAGRMGRIIFAMIDARLPFPAEIFDAVCANQVLEHVDDLDLALAEIDRVLAPGGMFLSITPTIEVWREGHCGISLSQRLHKYPRLQFAYLLAARSLGFGLWKEGRGRREWAREMTTYMQKRTSYRSAAVLCAAQSARIGPVKRIEPALAAYRLARRARLSAIVTQPLFAPIAQASVTRFGNMVCIARKPVESAGHRSVAPGES